MRLLPFRAVGFFLLASFLVWLPCVGISCAYRAESGGGLIFPLAFYQLQWHYEIVALALVSGAHVAGAMLVLCRARDIDREPPIIILAASLCLAAMLETGSWVAFMLFCAVAGVGPIILLMPFYCLLRFADYLASPKQIQTTSTA